LTSSGISLKILEYEIAILFNPSIIEASIDIDEIATSANHKLSAIEGSIEVDEVSNRKLGIMEASIEADEIATSADSIEGRELKTTISINTSYNPNCRVYQIRIDLDKIAISINQD